MASSKRHQIDTIVVEGKRPFPLDMLRHDCCYPISETDSHAMENTIGRQNVSPLRVGLYLRNGCRQPTVGRWKSFGWQVAAAFNDRGELILHRLVA